MLSLIQLTDAPNKNEFIKLLNIARIFKNNTPPKYYFCVEFTDIDSQIKNFLSGKNKKWDEVELDMITQCKNRGCIMSINGRKIKYSDYVIDDYFEKSSYDIVSNSVELLLSIIAPICTYTNGVIYGFDNINIDFIEKIKNTFSESTPRMGKLNTNYTKI
jgi:hypothetical protein